MQKQMQITVLFKGLLAALLLTAFSGAALAETVNLNTADAEALQYIPGIGPGKAEDIIRVREETGGFKTMEDLLAVPGIGAKTLETIQEFGSLDSGVSTLTEEMAENPPTRAKSKSAKDADDADEGHEMDDAANDG